MVKASNYYNLEKLSVIDPPFRDFIDVIATNASKYADKKIYFFADDGRDFSQSITYGELYSNAVKMAGFLSNRVGHGGRVLLIYSSGIDFVQSVVACILSGVIAVPAPPPRNSAGFVHLANVISNCRPSFVFYGTQVEKYAQQNRIKISDLLRMPAMTVGECLNNHAKEISTPFQPRINETVLLQYTSGSTGNPKGVIITHDNLIANCCMFGQPAKLSDKTIRVTWLPVYHDMGFIDAVISNLFFASTTYAMDSSDFIRDPICWMEAISNFRADISGGPNFSFDLIERRVGKMANVKLTLDCLKIFYCGSEPIQFTVLERFANTFSKFGFDAKAIYPCYGLAETTLITTSTKLNESYLAVEINDNLMGKAGQKLVSVGSCFDNEDILILDQQSKQIMPMGEVGEIAVCGPHVSPGYWQNPEATDSGFVSINGERFLLTGDLGLVIDSRLFISGRKKDLIILNGRNVYPTDIEGILARMKELKPGGTIALSHQNGAKESLLLLCELRLEFMGSEYEQICQQIASLLYSEIELSARYIFLVAPGTVLKTTSGKPRRQHTKEAFYKGEILPVYPAINDTTLFGN